MKQIELKKVHRIVIQVDQNGPAVMNLALNNATNVIDYYRAKNEDPDVDAVKYGPGLHILRADTSPVKGRIKSLKDYAFRSKSCNNTKQGMEKQDGHSISVLPEAVIVPSGVVRLKEKGWSYLRPEEIRRILFKKSVCFNVSPTDISPLAMANCMPLRFFSEFRPVQ